MSGGSREAVASRGNPGSVRWEERSVERVVASGRDQLLERSRRIVEVAYELLDEGLEELTIRAVLNKAGLSRRAFYERFSGKDDLILAVFEHTLHRASQHYRAQMAAYDDPLQRLSVLVTLLVLGREALDEPALDPEGRRGAAMSREHLRLAESHPDELQQALDPLIQVIADELSSGMAAGQVRAGDPRRMARLVYNLVSTTVHTELLSRDSAHADREQLAREIWEFCHHAVEA